MKFPKSVVLELTYLCNHKCLFCSCPWENKYSKYNKNDELNLNEWEKAIELLLDNGIENFSISGGEAILRNDAAKIISSLRKSLNSRQIFTEITLISNGRSLSKKWLRFFKKNNVHLCISLPGIETFCEQTGVDNVDNVLRWFSEARSIGLKTTANITVTKINLHELQKNIALALLHGADDVLLNRFLPGGRGLTYMKALMISTKELNQMLNDAEHVLSLANRHGNIGTEMPLCSIDNPIKYKYLHIGYKCAAAMGFFVVGPSGEIRVCNHSPKVVGHIFHKGLIDDWEYWNYYAMDTVSVDECDGCLGNVICSCGCREVAHILFSNLNKPDPSINLTHKNLYS